MAEHDLERDLDKLEEILRDLEAHKLRTKAMLATERLIGRELGKSTRVVVAEDGRVHVYENKNRAIYDPHYDKIAYAEFEEEDVVINKEKWLRVEPVQES